MDENPGSPTYNLHVRQTSSPGGASENLYDAGTAYNLAVHIAYPTRIPGKGSAFFLHVGTGSPTAGCVSIDQTSLRAIIRWLDHSHRIAGQPDPVGGWLDPVGLEFSTPSDPDDVTVR